MKLNNLRNKSVDLIQINALHIEISRMVYLDGLQGVLWEFMHIALSLNLEKRFVVFNEKIISMWELYRLMYV